jgi:hypothetical protein
MDCWLARDGFGMLQLHHSKPFWDDKKEDWISGLKIGILSSLDFEFKDITFENSPVKVEINLKNSKNMENKKINIAELLINCPKGMELDCTICNGVKFIELDRNPNYPIVVRTNGYEFSLTKYGQVHNLDNAKCVIFPKGKDSWEGFVPPVEFKDSGKIHTWTIKDAKDGDVISYDDGWTCIFKCIHGIWYSSYCFITDNGDFHTGYEEHAIDSEINGNAHPATKEQCNLLFQKIKEAGYKWNQETKTLEKLIEPKFRDGDIVSAIISSVGGTWIGIFKQYENGGTFETYCGLSPIGEFHNTNSKRHLVIGTHLATEEEKAKLFKSIKEKGYRWDAETKTLEELPKFKVGDKIKRKNINYTYTATVAGFDGEYYSCVDQGGDCLSIYKTDTSWELIPKFNDGDILAFENLCTTVFIYRNSNKDNEQNFSTSFYVGYTIGGLYSDFHVYDKNSLIALAGDRIVRYATEEEKEKLFQAIESNGYKWNPETKTLEEVTKPKFEVGDRIKHKVTSHYYTIEEVKNDCYYVKSNKDDECFSLVLFLFEKDYELVPNKFDISSLIPYESKVLVRNSPAGYWMPTFWGAYVSKNPGKHQNRMYLTTKGFTNYCIPFEGNEALMGTADDCDNFYKTWEE